MAVVFMEAASVAVITGMLDDGARTVACRANLLNLEEASSGDDSPGSTFRLNINGGSQTVAIPVWFGASK